MAQTKKLALSPFFILLYIHLALNIFLPWFFVFRHETRDHEAFMHLSLISTVVLFIILFIVWFSHAYNLGQVVQSKWRMSTIIVLLLVHLVVSLSYAIVGRSPLCWVSVIDIALMIVFLSTTITKVYV